MSIGPSDYLSWISGVISILSLVASGYAAYGIKQLRAEMIARVRLPVLLDAMTANSSKLVGLMDSYNEVSIKRLFDIELAKCAANLKMIKQKLSQPHQKALGIDALLGKIERPGGHLSVAEAWASIAALNGFTDHLKGVIQERQLGA
ncbi:MAG: hypothetical protein WAN86_19435 [Hyphomicrobiaceae bacterium]